MNKIDWVFYITLAILAALLFLGFFTSGCALLQRRDTSTVAPSPGVRLWETVKKSNWLVSLAIPIVALGAVAVFNGSSKLGFSAIIFGCVNLFMALATARFALWMAIFGLIGSGLAVAVSILSKNKALIEIIKGVQIFKNNELEPDSVRHLKGELGRQSSSTQKIVQEIKTDLKAKGEI